jgi:signal transduction histidine kinase
VEPLLTTVGLSKSFGTAPALRRVNLKVHPGEVLGVAGESGSGKSVLCMLLAGLYAADEGEISFAGQRLKWPFRARALGIETIHQTPELVKYLDITSNIFLGVETQWPLLGKWPKVTSWRRMDKEAARILAQLGMHFDSLREDVANLSLEQRQVLAIARTMARSPRMIIIDDPAPLLSYPYQQRLLSLIQDWQRQGIAIIFTSNYLDHLMAVTDRIIVLRHGCRVAEYRTDETGREEIVATMVGTMGLHQRTPVIWALSSYYHAREQAEKLRYKQVLLERNLAAQDTLKRQLNEQLAMQIDALDRANAALQDAQRRLLTEREQERKHLAREIHDQVIQDLLGVNHHLDEIEEDEDLTSPLRNELADARNSICKLVTDLRHICNNLRPPTIDSLGLGAALQSHTHDWTKRTGIPVELELDANLGRLPEAIELSVFRIVQEGLSNIRRHAHANAVQIYLKHTSPRLLMISIADDGQGLDEGFDLAALSVKGHYGLLGISERVALLGGRLRLQNQAGGGMLLQAEIPHPRVAQPDGTP